MHWTIKKKIGIFFTVGVENYFSLKKQPALILWVCNSMRG